MLQLDNINELVLEEQASSSITVTTTTTEDGAEDLDAHLLSLETFQEDCMRRLAHLRDERSAVTEPECFTDATKEEENVESGNGEGDKREDIKEEGKIEEKEEEEEEGVRMAQASLKEICNDLSTLGTPLIEGRSVRPKIQKDRIKSVDFQLSGESDSIFAAGQQVEEKPRPRKDSGYSFTIDTLEKELTNLLDMFLTKDATDNVNDDATTNITTATTIATATTTTPTSPRSPITTTTTTTTSSPVTSSSQTTITIPPRTPSPTPTITSTTTITPPRSPCSPNTIRSTTTVTPPLSPLPLTSISSVTPQTPRSPTSTATTPLTPRSPVTPTTTPTTETHPSSEPLVFTFPSSPTSLSSFTFASSEPTTPLQRKAKSLSVHHVPSHSRSSSSYHVLSPLPPPSPSERKEEYHFFSTIKEGMKNFGRRNSLRKKKKKRPEIGEPQDFRTLTSTTSIKPDDDPWIKVVK
ncbi:nuclear pore complex protein DDB_G0274915-like isoform X2 [Portunus trituberculatus]|uniref:nuclear pore complex protein DDB_G0274915-like isoform X2 n=1 Tax=Portunus trituberculatus TaxID=210409 RepID=UPI001E1D0C4F|nr:nuclear pore complex protein DDB_G0274915-like isoform X2 [Portunus trituberculatus]